MPEHGVMVEVFEEPARSCAHCKQEAVRVDDGGLVIRRHDACIARMPAVIAACCGHGYGLSGGLYIYREDGTTLYGAPAAVLMRELGGDPPG